MKPYATKTLKAAEMLRFAWIFLGFLTALVALVVLYRQHAPAAGEAKGHELSGLQKAAPQPVFHTNINVIYW